MFENLLIFLAVYMTAVQGALFFKQMSVKFDKWRENSRIHADFRKRVKEIRKRNLQHVIDCIGFKIEDNYQYYNNMSKPDKIKLARMMKREYAQWKDYGLFDDMNRCRYVIEL